MLRKIIKIDQDKCNGCGLCAQACHEGAIGMKDGKAVLLRDDYCDGLGNCLPVCPTNAISFEMREAAAYDQEAVDKHLAAKKEAPKAMPLGGCPGSRSMTINRPQPLSQNAEQSYAPLVSQLNQWPVQIQLVPPVAPYFDNAKLLIAADCTAYAYANFHKDFMKGKITLIGCPKLDEVDYSHKLTDILVNNDIQSLTVVRMEMPCCGGIVHAVKTALQNSGKIIPWQVVTISTNGNVID